MISSKPFPTFAPTITSGPHNWHLQDALSDATYERNGDEMLSPGLYLELGPWNYHCFQCLRTMST
jgi:hypothetical protein